MQYQVCYRSALGVWYSKPYDTYSDALAVSLKEKEYQDKQRYNRYTTTTVVVAYSPLNKDSRKEP